MGVTAPSGRTPVIITPPQNPALPLLSNLDGISQEIEGASEMTVCEGGSRDTGKSYSRIKMAQQPGGTAPHLHLMDLFS